MVDSTDSVLRAITNDGAFRVITVRTTDTVQAAIESQRGTGATAEHFANLLTGAVLFRETMAPQLRVQAILRSATGPASLVADSHPSGKIRGLIQLHDGSTGVEIAPGAMLRMMRSLPTGRLNQGVVQVPPAGGISEALMAYMSESEQIVSMIAVDCVMHEGRATAAGGYLVQLLPEVGRGPLAAMTERLKGFQQISGLLSEASFSPAWLVQKLLADMPFTTLEESDVRFECWCSEVRVLSALATLSRGELMSLITDGNMVEMSCDYCGKDYQVGAEQLKGLLSRS